MTDALTRIAAALDRLAPPPTPAVAAGLPAYLWRNGALVAAPFAPLPLDLLSGIDAQRDAYLTNARHHACGFAAHDVLLWGARGMGKSALVKASVAALQREGLGLTMVEFTGDPATLPDLFSLLAEWSTPTVVFFDDLGFDDLAAARVLRPILDGGAVARPAHVRLSVTSNRRHVVRPDVGEAEAAAHARDVLDDGLALADRFGLSLGFHAVDQAGWLAMVELYASRYALPFDPVAALRFAAARGSRSGRVAWHYTVEVAGAAGRTLR